ncbi:peroxisomal biogenesis factor 19 [Onthophagus taurus]|uniref:peroxisomal biogenesis factor 19 n=1 Tax=Onthophagus taurus TaxID=166361 RepID=UPI000C201367|nr:peroxisomal biogenesis factor 19 [Onthophagus taurus]
MSEEKKVEEVKKSTDEELADLLDSALEDFSDKKDEKESQKPAEDDKKDESPEVDLDDIQWSEEFLRQATQQFQTDISRMCGNIDPNVNLSPDQIQESLQKMAEAAQSVLSNPAPPNETSTDFSAAITQTLRGLSEGTENLENPFSDQDLLNMFTGGSGAGSEQNSFIPFMQGMMQSLLSKEVLYPSLKDIMEKYPGWLQSNASTLAQEDRLRFENQQRLMEDICKELEAETETDSAEIKKERFEKVLSMMQKLQDYGQPPAELLGDVGPGFQFDQLGNPNMEQCSVM